jgi:membrane-associated protease RseP (regulator of RpoE activity)
VLGCDENSLLVAPHIVGGVIADSAAAKAGLRDGDKIVAFTGARPRIAHSASNVALDRVLRLDVERDGKALSVQFSTEGPRIPEYAWAVRKNVKTGCAF